jgi:NAD+ kinase
MRLAVTYCPEDGEPVALTAVNDAVVHQGAMARLVELEARLNQQFIASYRADGLIVCTPTGSTAYNLAAGGPILSPRQQALVLTPICAHTLTNRPLVLASSDKVTVRVAAGSRGVVLTLDGLWAHTFSPGDRVDISAGARPLVVFESEKPYFDILRDKLHWAAPAAGRNNSQKM